MKNKHLISPMDFSKEELNEIFELAEKFISNPKEFSHICDGKILATLFYEPSTRTRFSFEAAMMRLGGKILGFSEPNSTSSAKGETLADTIRMVSIYSDIIAMRHPKEGAAKVASMYSSVPVINAGDGGHQHPTQTLTDLLTIKSQKGKLEGHTIGICGDLKNGRTVQSLIMAMSRYKDVKFILISPKELVIPEYIKEEVLKRNNIFATIRRYLKKLKPQYNGDVYLETVRCYFDISQENLEKCRYTYQGNETYAFLMSDKYIMALYTHCLVARKEAAMQDMQVDGFTEKEYGMVRLENVGDVLFQALLLDNIKNQNGRLFVELCTMYRLY